MFTEFSGYRAKDTGATGGFIIFNNNGSVLIEFDVRTICTARFFYRSDNNGFHNVAFFNNAAGCCLFNGTNHDITDTGIATSGTTENTDAHKFLGTGVVGNSH